MSIPGFDETLVELLVSPKIPQHSWRREALNQGFLPICDDWEHFYALTPDGKSVYSQYLDFRDPQVITSNRWHVAILAQTAATYPQLDHIRPVRRPEDPTCPNCGGTGALKLVQGEKEDEILAVGASKNEGQIICGCGGSAGFRQTQRSTMADVHNGSRPNQRMKLSQLMRDSLGRPHVH